MGDSNAAQYSEAAIGAGRSLGRPVQISTAAACPFADVYRGYADGHRDAGDEACRSYYDTTMAHLAGEPPSVVVIAESASQWLLEDRQASGRRRTTRSRGSRTGHGCCAPASTGRSRSSTGAVTAW